MLRLKNISVSYGKGESAVHALREVSLSLEAGVFAAILGKSGCGKTTLLNVLGGILPPASGEYFFEGGRVDILSPNALARFRNTKVGFVVQHFALIQDMTIEKNVALPLTYRRLSRDAIRKSVRRVLERLEISDQAGKYPYELSGGQRQRAAIARAIVTNPPLILADEPTGALDKETGEAVFSVFQALNAQGTAIVLVTHDLELAGRCEEVYQMSDGRIVKNW